MPNSGASTVTMCSILERKNTTAAFFIIGLFSREDKHHFLKKKNLVNLQTSRFQVFIPISRSFRVHLLQGRHLPGSAYRQLRRSITAHNETQRPLSLKTALKNALRSLLLIKKNAGFSELHGVNDHIKNNG